MHLSTKKLAFLGLLLALTDLLIILSGVLEFNTLFLLAAASYGVGIAIRESGNQYGFGFYLASILLGLILAPNKLYCITYAAMGFYIVIFEFSYDKLMKIKSDKRRRNLHWIIKYVVFNLMFIPIIIFLPTLIYPNKMSVNILAVIIFAGQVALFIYDMAYAYFQRDIWGKMRSRMKL